MSVLALTLLFVNFAPLVSTAAVNWNYSSGMSVDVYGIGMHHNNPARINIPNPSNVDHIIALVMGFKTKVHIYSSQGEYYQIQNPPTTGWYHHARFNPSNWIEVRFDYVEGGGADALFVYVFRNTGSKDANVGSLPDLIEIWTSSSKAKFHTLSFTIPAAPAPRDIDVTFSISNLEDDDRGATMQAQAGNVFRERTDRRPNLGSEGHIATLTLPDVPGNVTTVYATVKLAASNTDSVFFAGVNVRAEMPDAPIVPGDIPDMCIPSESYGVNYEHTMSAQGGTEPYTFAVTQGSLPDGLTLSSDGRLSGFLTLSSVAEHTFTITATDASGKSGSRTYYMDLYSCHVGFRGFEFDVNGTTYQDQNTLPDYFNDNNFDWNSGLGTLTIEFKPGDTGDYSIVGTFDYLFDTTSPESFTFSENTEGNLADGQLIGIDVVEQSIATVLGWEFSLAENEWAKIIFSLGETLIDTAYIEFSYLDQSGICKDNIPFSSRMEIVKTEPVPEPSTIVLISVDLLGVIAVGRKRRNK